MSKQIKHIPKAPDQIIRSVRTDGEGGGGQAWNSCMKRERFFLMMILICFYPHPVLSEAGGRLCFSGYYFQKYRSVAVHRQNISTFHYLKVYLCLSC